MCMWRGWLGWILTSTPWTPGSCWPRLPWNIANYVFSPGADLGVLAIKLEIGYRDPEDNDFCND
jgi:hypothetical protein